MVRVCVIGAGAAGLAAAKQSIDKQHEVVVYEQTSQIGGTWVYSNETDIHSAMYEVMKTNLPKEIMLYRDVPYRADLPSFMDHQDVLQYLEEYARPLPIQFDSTVETVTPIDGDRWQVTIHHQDKQSVEEFDVVFVCNGHYFAPRIPFNTENFEGSLLHSHDYRRARDYAGQKVVVAGAGPSGIDIALQVAEQAKEVVLLGKKAIYDGLPENISQRPVHLSKLTGHSITLSDGTIIEEIDAVIVCTGYEMKFPFLSDDIISVKAEGQMVSPLWEHVVHVDYPKSLFFIGLNLVTVTLTLFEHQVKMALGLVDGSAPLPSRDELVGWEQRRLDDLATRGMDAHFYHFLGPEQWEYFDRLAQLGNFEKWQYHEVMHKMFDVIFKRRSTDIAGYKKINFKMNGTNDDFDVIG